MSNGLFRVPTPVNEPTLAYAPGSPERTTLKAALQRLASERIDIPVVIAGKEIRTGKTRQQTMPHKHQHVLATYHEADPALVSRAIDAAMAVRRQWAETPFHERAAIFLKAADLLATRTRSLVTGATMLGQSKTVFQAEIDAAYSNWFVFQLLREAGLPDGVINFVQGDPATVSDAVLEHPDLGGVHFTGSTQVFQLMWKKVGENIGHYRQYPRLVGETGGKDFVFVHPSASEDLEAVAVALARGAYEYQGQKCSAASRAYVPGSLLPRLKERLVALIGEIRVGDVRDFRNFRGAVIDEKAFKKITGYLQVAKSDPKLKIVAGGEGDSREGWFIQPTLIESSDPKSRLMCEEIFGPVLTVFVYPDAKLEETLRVCDQSTPYALTGAIFARDRAAVELAARELRHAAGNFYVNDKPTGAVVGQQPFGGSRASGTNDKAGSAWNLMRWISPRTIKENFVPPTSLGYPHMAGE